MYLCWCTALQSVLLRHTHGLPRDVLFLGRDVAILNPRGLQESPLGGSWVSSLQLKKTKEPFGKIRTNFCQMN